MAATRFVAGAVGFAVYGAVGAHAALHGAVAPVAEVLAPTLGALAGIAALWLLRSAPAPGWERRGRRSGHDVGGGARHRRELVDGVAVAHALGHPFEQLITFGGLVMNGVFDRYPSLRICFLEGRAGMAAARPRTAARLLRHSHPELLMYSSDFPHEVTSASCAEALDDLRKQPDLSDEMKAGILGNNAQRFYKFDR